MKVKLLSLIILIATSGSVLSNVLITTFGNSATPTFAVDNLFTTFSTVTPSASSISFSGIATNTLSGTFSTIDLTGYSQLRIQGSSSDTSLSNFDIFIYDTNDNQAVFNGGSWADVRTLGSSLLSLGTFDVGFSFSSIYAVDITFQGNPSDSIDGSFTSLSAVPEPGSALLLGLGAAGLYLLRRRKAKA